MTADQYGAIYGPALLAIEILGRLGGQREVALLTAVVRLFWVHGYASAGPATCALMQGSAQPVTVRARGLSPRFWDKARNTAGRAKDLTETI